MSIMKRFGAAAAATAALSAVAALAPASAHAATSDCGAGNLCVWRDSGYSNSRYSFAGNNTSWHAWAIADEDSSWFNNGTSGANVQVYRDTGYVNTTVCVRYKSAISYNSYANDKGSSNRWGGC